MIDVELEIESSFLCRTLDCDGFEVSIFIYRILRANEGWRLEVFFEDDTSTVWEKPFDTDQAALDEVMRTIDEEGISVFIRPPHSELH